MAALWYFKGEHHKAIADYQRGCRLNPGDAFAHNSVAWLLTFCPDREIRDGKLAVESGTIACKLSNWKEPEFLDTLACAYAATGDLAASRDMAGQGQCASIPITS